jgi:hypothetical protein
MHQTFRHALAVAAALAITVGVSGFGLTSGTAWAAPPEKKAAPARAAPRAAPARMAPRSAPMRVAPRAAPRMVGPRVAPRVVGPRVGPGVAAPRIVSPGVRSGPRIGGRVGGPLVIGGRSVAVVRGPRSVFWRGRNRSLVSLGLIAGFSVGAVAYSAYGYLPVDEPYCTGITEDGCELRWQDVPTPEGDLIPQCVTFCPIQ